MFENEMREFVRIVRESISEPHFEDMDGDMYYIDRCGKVEKIKHLQMYPRLRTVYGLDMFCKWIKTEWPEIRSNFYSEDVIANTLMIDISGHNMVSAYTSVFVDNNDDFIRLNLYQAEERAMPGVPRDYLDFDEARIRFNACFERTEDMDYVLGLLSNVVRGENAEIKDNGVTQVVKVNKGVQMLSMETVRPIVRLKPYRTFPEICQPESDFLLRIKDDKVGLFEADGGMWKHVAKASIKEYLEEALTEQIEAGLVVVGM